MAWDESKVDPKWAALQQAIGTLRVSASALEGTVRSVLLNMMGGPHWRRSGLVIEGYSTSQMRERCLRLAGIVLDGELRDDVVAWLKEVTEAQADRNKIVHGEWTHLWQGADKPTIGPVSQMRKVNKRSPYGLDTVTSEFTPEDIRDMAGRLSKAMIDGRSLIMELQVWSESERRQGGADLTPWTRPVPDHPSCGPDRRLNPAETHQGSQRTRTALWSGLSTEVGPALRPSVSAMVTAASTGGASGTSR